MGRNLGYKSQPSVSPIMPTPPPAHAPSPPSSCLLPFIPLLLTRSSLHSTCEQLLQSAGRQALKQYIARQAHVGGAGPAAGSCLEGGRDDGGDVAQMAGMACVPEEWGGND